MTISEYQSKVDDWIKSFGVRYFSELTNMAVLTEEVGELSRLMAREYGDQSFKSPVEPSDIKMMISDELADILFVVTCLSNQMDIDLESAIANNFDKKTNRDKTRHQDNSKL
ncbi:MAG: nucleotide pyrophosphohydrolase [Saprospiraceae bacterium]|nr:nucleotide pyrophosphohydrolase [Bacteroidia bacterium]NNE13383.1 nucleotide pyrophosphohydrolase [Saprospiraceae bacterium]NNL91068.1 nucleotide pyrophosphohydrolase [Saprospiraceae bacterium]